MISNLGERLIQRAAGVRRQDDIRECTLRLNCLNNLPGTASGKERNQRTRHTAAHDTSTLPLTYWLIGGGPDLHVFVEELLKTRL
jgi:hypothetical protein